MFRGTEHVWVPLMKDEEEEKEEEGHKEERERSRCQTRNFAFTQRELIKYRSCSTLN